MEMTHQEHKVLNAVWAYLRDHGKTPEGNALRNSIGKIITKDLLKKQKTKERRQTNNGKPSQTIR